MQIEQEQNVRLNDNQQKSLEDKLDDTKRLQVQTINLLDSIQANQLKTLKKKVRKIIF